MFDNVLILSTMVENKFKVRTIECVKTDGQTKIQTKIFNDIRSRYPS